MFAWVVEIEGLAVTTGLRHAPVMDAPSQWERLKDLLTEWEAGLPVLSDSELENLFSIGEALPELLFESDDQGREALDEVISMRTEGEDWPELPATSKIHLRARFEWAFAIVGVMERCGVPAPDSFCPSTLLIDGWDASGASYTHEDFLRKYLHEVLQGAVGGHYKRAGG